MGLWHTCITHPGSAPAQWAVFLHGFFGRGQDWAEVAQQTVAQRPDWGVALVDLRLHGESVEASPPHTLQACIEDVRRFTAANFGPSASVLLGHSFGGKVALGVAREPEASLRQVWAVDASPGVPLHQGGTWRLLAALEALPGPYETREEIVRHLREKKFSDSVVGWMLNNLEREDGHFRWRFPLEGMRLLLADGFDSDLWGAIEERGARQPQIHIVRASRSHRVGEEAAARIREAQARHSPVALHTLEGSHWLHVDNPQGLSDLLAAELPR